MIHVIRRHSLHVRRWRTPSLAAAIVALAACHHDSTGPGAPHSVPVRVVAGGNGVAGARLVLNADHADSLSSGITDDQGRAEIPGARNGSFLLTTRLPLGYAPSSSTPHSVTISTRNVAEITIDVQRIDSTTHSFAAGDTASIAIASGMSVEVAEQNGAPPVTVGLRPDPASAGSTGLAAPVMLTVSVPGMASSPSGGYGAAGGAGTITVKQVLPDGTQAAYFAANIGSATDPIWIYSTETTTTIERDPVTGASRTVAVQQFAPTSSDATYHLLVVDGANVCTGPEANAYKLYSLDSAPLASRIPLILIHGWKFDLTECRQFQNFAPENSTFKNLIASFTADPGFGSRFKIYVLRYPTMAHIAAASAFLAQEIASQGITQPIFLAHSMGGLVARGYMATGGSANTRALISLATPFAGSPLADPTPNSNFGDCVDRSSGSFFEPGLAIGTFIPGSNMLLRKSDGAHDLSPSSEFISSLKGVTGDGERVYAIGGVLDRSDGFLMPFTDCLLREQPGVSSTTVTDGIVPLSSALPLWSSLQWWFNGVDHLSITDDPSVRAHVVSLLDTLAACVPAPAPLARNDFTPSAAVQRTDRNTVQVTLNPIIIDGQVISTIPASAITVIENGCIRPHGTISAGHGKLDLVFIQDLSGSMDEAIDGISSSVRSFAQTLQNSGLDVRFGSVGYSGPGDIPSSPAGSFDEQLGPVQTLTDVTTFRNHVLDEWFSVGGGDIAENGLEAIEYAHMHMPWRVGSTRVYIDVTNSSHHVAGDDCDDAGPCTDETPNTIATLIGPSAAIDVVAPDNIFDRLSGGGADPWTLAGLTGGAKLTLPLDGFVDLNALGVTSLLRASSQFTYTSMTSEVASLGPRIRIQLTVNGTVRVAELSTGIVAYDRSSKQRSNP